MSLSPVLSDHGPYITADVVCLNLFIYIDQCWQEDLKTVISQSSLDWKQTLPLQEDINLTKLPPLKQVHEELVKRHSVKLTETQEVYIKVAPNIYIHLYRIC